MTIEEWGGVEVNRGRSGRQKTKLIINQLVLLCLSYLICLLAMVTSPSWEVDVDKYKDVSVADVECVRHKWRYYRVFLKTLNTLLYSTLYVESVATRNQPVQTGYQLVFEKISCNCIVWLQPDHVDWLTMVSVWSLRNFAWDQLVPVPVAPGSWEKNRPDQTLKHYLFELYLHQNWSDLNEFWCTHKQNTMPNPYPCTHGFGMVFCLCMHQNASKLLQLWWKYSSNKCVPIFIVLH